MIVVQDMEQDFDYAFVLARYTLDNDLTNSSGRTFIRYHVIYVDDVQ